MKQNNESPIEQITQEFADSGTLFYLEAKYLSLVTKAIHVSNFTKALPDRMGCRGKAGKIAIELVTRFLNNYGLILTNNAFNDEYSQNLSNRDVGSTLINIVKLKDEANPLHELVQVMKNTERHQYHHPKLVQALMNKVPHLLNIETKSHFNSILSRATFAKNNREKNSKRLGNSDENYSPINRIPQDNKNDSLFASRSANMYPDVNQAIPSPNNQITATIQQPIVFLDEGADNDSPGKSKPQNLLLTLNVNLNNPTNPDEQATLELSPPLPNPSQITATAVLLPEGDEYQKISSSNGTNQLFNEEESMRERPPQVLQNREIHNLNYLPNQNPNENEYEYAYEYEEVEEEQIHDVEPNKSTSKNKKEKKKGPPKKSPKKQKPSKKSKKNSIDPQIQQQLEQQQLIIQKLQELNQFQQQQQQEQQLKFQQQLQQQELQQQQLQQLLQKQQLQQEKIQQQLEQEQKPKYSKNDEYDEYSSAKSVSSYTNNTALSEEEEKEEIRIEQPRASFSEASMTSVADFINDQTEDVKKREIKSVSNALDNLLKNKNQVINESDESTIIIPIDKKEQKPQLHIQEFSMPEVPFNENNDYYSDLTERNENNQDSEYSNYSNYSNIKEKGQNSDYSNYTNYSKINEEESVPETQTRKNLIQQPESQQQQQLPPAPPIENANSSATSVTDKEYPDAVIRSIKDAFSPRQDKNDSFETTSTQLQQSKTVSYYSTYYTNEYYSEEEEEKEDRRRKDDQKQVKFKLRINREQFERFYPNQNLSNTQTIKVSKQGLNQLKELMTQKNGNEPFRQVIRLRTPTIPPSPSPFMSQQQQQQQNTPHQHKEQPYSSTISVVTKGPHTGLIKRKIKKSDHQADIQKKLKEKTEYAKKLQEELERRTKEMEQQQQQQQQNIQISNKKLVRSQPQTKTKRNARDRSPSPKEIDRPSSAPKKKSKKISNYKKRDINLNNDFETINTSSLIPSTISTVSEVHPELMSPKQREQKKKEIKSKIKKLRNELNLRNDPEEKRLKRAKIEAKLQQLRDEFERSSDQAEREVKRQKINSNLKKLNSLDQNANFTKAPRNNNNINNNDVENMTPTQRRKRRNELELELQKLYKEFDKNSEEQPSNDQLENQRPIIPRRNIKRDIEPIHVQQQRPKQQRELNIESNSYTANNGSGASGYFIPSYENQSGYSYNSKSNIETEESYSQSPIQKQQQQIKNDRMIDDVNVKKQPPPIRLQPPIPRNSEILDNLNDDDDNEKKFFNVGESSSLSERRGYSKMKVDIPKKDGKEDIFKKYNDHENRRKDDADINEELDSNNYDDRDPVSINSYLMKQPEYKPPKINIKKKTATKNKGTTNSSQISEKGEVVEETIVIKDGKKKLKKRIHIPLPHQNTNNNNLSDNYNYKGDNEYDVQSDENYDSKKVTAKSSSKLNQQKGIPLKNLDDGLAIKNDENNLSSDYSNLNSKDVYSSFVLHVKVVEAKDVPNIDSFDPCDPYCLLFVEGQNEDNSRRTKSMERTSDPVWNESFEFYINNEKQNKRRRKYSSQPSQNCILNVQLKDEDANAGDVLLSSTKINLLDYQIGKIYDMWFSLQNEASSDDYKSKNKEISRSAKSEGNTTNSSKGSGSIATKSGGKVHLVFEKTAMLDEGENDNEDENGNKSASYSASNSYKSLNGAKLFENQNGQKIRLNVLIDQAEGLSRRNQYIVLKIKNSQELMKTKPINSSDPIWNESFKLKLPNPQEDTLLITLRARDEKNGDDDIGNITIPISTLTPPNSGQIVDKWYEFKSTSYASKTKNRRGTHLSVVDMCGKIHLILSTEFDKDDSISYSNSVTPNASSNNSAYRGSSSIPKINQNPAMIVKQQVPNSTARHLAVQIVEARGLPSHCFPYCIVQIRNEKPIFHTRAVRTAPRPKWNQKLDFHSRKAVEDGILDIMIKDKRSNNDQEIASLSLSVEELNQSKMAVISDEDNEDEEFVINKWFPLEPTGEIHLIIVPRMKDSPKPTILTPIDNKDNYKENDINDNIKSDDDITPGIQIDASSSDIDIDVEFDVKNEKNNNTKKKHRRNRRSSGQVNPEIDSHKKKILDQFPPTTSEEE